MDDYGDILTAEDAKRYWELVENVMRQTREGSRGRLPSIFMKYVRSTLLFPTTGVRHPLSLETLPQAAVMHADPSFVVLCANSPADGEFVLSPIRLGSRGDSYYEYLLCVLLHVRMETCR